jgi:hypothetical protein
MSCERYWREGIALVERGEPDPHRATCEDCRIAHAARHELIQAIPMIGRRDSGHPQWQARVWRQIARERSIKTMWLCAKGALVAAAITTLFWLFVFHRGDRDDQASGVVASLGDDVSSQADHLPSIEIISGPVAKRSTSARVGDRVRISARSSDEIRIYRDGELMLTCAAESVSSTCLRPAYGLVAETPLDSAGDYQLVVITSGAVRSGGKLDPDLAAIVGKQGDYQLTYLEIR